MAEIIGSMTSPMLCYIGYAGSLDDKRLSAPELARRGFTCTPERIAEGKIDYEARMASYQQRAAIDAQADAERRQRALEAGLQLLTPPAPPRQQQCQWQTNANGTGSMVCF